ncbi:hypothetical protein DRQ17_07840 [bacterium]|nr:MAG: hypothetical protein DRQ17_07840 [bacterium]
MRKEKIQKNEKDAAHKYEMIINRELKSYPRAKELFMRLKNDPEVTTYLESANTMMIGRFGYTDHGRTHALIVTANALRIARLLLSADVPWESKESMGFNEDDIRCVIVAASYLHDIGNAIHRNHHNIHGVLLATNLLRNNLSAVYEDWIRGSRLLTEALHAIYVHDAYNNPELEVKTMEAGVVSVADGTDLTAGRTRIPFKLGKIDIHSVSAMSISNINIKRGKIRPVLIEIDMKESAGIFQVQAILGEKIKNSPLKNYISVVARTRANKKPLELTFEYN